MAVVLYELLYLATTQDVWCVNPVDVVGHQGKLLMIAGFIVVGVIECGLVRGKVHYTICDAKQGNKKSTQSPFNYL